MSTNHDLSVNDSKSFFSTIKGLFSNKIVVKVFRIIKSIILYFILYRYLDILRKYLKAIFRYEYNMILAFVYYML